MLTIVGLICGFLISLGTAFISYQDKRNDFKAGRLNSMSYRTVFIIALAGALITLVTNLTSNYDKNQSSLKASKLNDSLFRLNASLSESQKLNIKLSLQQLDSTHQLLSLQQKLIEANVELNKANSTVIDLQNSLSDNIIGAGNLPRISISRASGDRYYRNLSIIIRNVGESPLRGLRANITDIYSNTIFNPKSKQYETTSAKDSVVLLEHVLDMEKQVQIGDLPSKSGKPFYYPRLPRFVNEFGLRVQLMWDNGYIHFGFSGSFKEPNETLNLKLDFINDNKNSKLPPELITFTTFNRSK